MGFDARFASESSESTCGSICPCNTGFFFFLFSLFVLCLVGSPALAALICIRGRAGKRCTRYGFAEVLSLGPGTAASLERREPPLVSSAYIPPHGEKLRETKKRRARAGTSECPAPIRRVKGLEAKTIAAFVIHPLSPSNRSEKERRPLLAQRLAFDARRRRSAFVRVRTTSKDEGS